METDSTETERFASLAEARAAYCELESESQSLLNEADAKVTALQAELQAANERADSHEADFNAASEQIESLKAANAEAASKIAALEASAKTAEAEAARIAASLGIDPVQLAISQSIAGNQMSRKEFEALSHRARREFLAAGGKIDQSTI